MKKVLQNNSDFEIGDVVAFNYSGDVKVGRVVKVGKDTLFYYDWKGKYFAPSDKPAYKKVNIDIAHLNNPKVVSKVRNSGSLVKLHKSIFY